MHTDDEEHGGLGNEGLAAMLPLEVGRVGLNPKSEVQRRHSPPSFAAQGISDLGAASLDAAHYSHEMPCTSKPGSDCLALYFGSRA
jgi:hypothetical protein